MIIFLRICKALGVPKGCFHKLLPHTLSPPASTFYNTDVRPTDTFAEAYRKLKNHFENKVVLAAYREEWHQFDFAAEQAANPSKTPIQALDDLFNKIQICSIA